MRRANGTQDPSRITWRLAATVVAIAAAELGMHAFALSKIANWQPGYPGLVVLGTFTPPKAMRVLHSLGPYFLLAAMLAFGWVAVLPRPDARGRLRSVVRWTSLGTVLGLLLLYLWSTLWVIRVARYIK